MSVMEIDVSKEQIEIEVIKNGNYIVTFYPCNRFVQKKSYYTMFEPGSRYYQMVKQVDENPDNWVMLNYLAMFVKKYDGQIVRSI